MFTWIQLDNLPSVPQQFIDQAFAVAQTADAEAESHFKLISNDSSKVFKRKLLIDGKEYPTRHQWSGELSKDWEDWVRTNIISSFINTGVRVSVGPEDTTWHGAHSDGYKGPPRKFVYKLYYLIEPGGDNVDTVFYKEVGQPVERTEEQAQFINDYSQLEVVDKVRLPLRKWVLLNTSILHGVENVTGPRTNLVVGIEKQQFNVNVSLQGQL